MISNDLWDFYLSELSYSDNIKLLISGRYLCEFIKNNENSAYCFTVLSKDANSCAKTSYANLQIHDNVQTTSYFGRLYMTLSDDLVGESRHSFMLYLKEHKDDEHWLASISIPTSNIELILTSKANTSTI